MYYKIYHLISLVKKEREKENPPGIKVLKDSV
jgi:hypothetical protein